MSIEYHTRRALQKLSCYAMASDSPQEKYHILPIRQAFEEIAGKGGSATFDALAHGLGQLTDNDWVREASSDALRRRSLI